MYQVQKRDGKVTDFDLSLIHILAVQENFRSLKRLLPFDRGRLRSFRASLWRAAIG